MSEPAGQEVVCESLAFRNVSLTYPGGENALRAIDFSVRQGETVAVCGANGTGKTTLLKLAAGLLAPTEGDVVLDGEPLNATTRKQAFRHIGFSFQDAEDQLFCSTVVEDIAYGPTNLGLPKGEIAERVHQAMDVMNITHLANRPIHHLSGGEKRRVALAGLLAMRPKILALDEPTSGLDPAGAAGLMATLTMLNREYGHTIIVATHEMDRIPEFAYRVLVLKDNTVFRFGRVTEVLTDVPALQSIGLDAPTIARYFFWKQQRGGNGHPIPLTVAEALKLS
ncbi:MAG: energy-coupling factor ABC transporter ATP-binding protein [Armatimonadota bacterium]